MSLEYVIYIYILKINCKLFLQLELEHVLLEQRKTIYPDFVQRGEWLRKNYGNLKKGVGEQQHVLLILEDIVNRFNSMKCSIACEGPH